MRRFMLGLMVAGGATLALAPGQAEAQVSAGIVLDRDGLRHVHLAIGHVYGVPVQSVSYWHPAWIHADELPVVYLLAREARVSPEVIIALREQGWSWLDITYHLGVDPGIYVAHLPATWGPRGHAYGYWRKPSRYELRRLNDRRIVDYVNVYFWAHAHRRPVTEIIVIRERMPTWVHYVRAEAPRVRFQEPARAQPAWTQPAPAPTTRPAQPRGTAQAPAAAPSRVPAPAAGRTPAPAATRTPAPAATRTPAPAATRTPAPAATRTPAPAANRTPTPAATRTPTPAANRTPPPAATRTPPPAATRTPPPTATRTPAPAASRAPTPAAARTPTPAATRAPAPAANRTPAPAASRAPTPAATRTPAPAATRTPTPAASRAPAPAATRPRAQGGGTAAPPRPAGRGN